MLAVVTALKVPNPGIQGNSTFEVLCGHAFRQIKLARFLGLR